MYRNLIDSGEYTIDSACSEYGVTSTKFKRGLEKLFFYEWILKQIGVDREEERLLKPVFNKIDRLILSTNGKNFLDYWINNKGDIIFADKNESDKKLKRLIPYIIDPHIVPTQATQEWLIENVFSRIDPNFSTGTRGLGKQKELELIKPARQRKTARERNQLLLIFGGDLILQKGDTNNIYRDILDLYKYYLKNKKRLSETFPASIRMLLRSLVESATSEGEEMKYYVKDNFENAKKLLTKDQKNTLSIYSINGDQKLTQFLNAGAHNYTNSANIEQTIAMSIIIGAMLKITHSRKREIEMINSSLLDYVQSVE